MKIKEGFVKHTIGEKSVVVATGELSIHFHGMIELNQSGSDIWDGLAKGLDKESIVDMLVNKYEISREIAAQDVENMINQMTEAEILELN